MFGLFARKQSFIQSGLLKDAVDNHSHILPGVDDGVRTLEESLEILSFLEEQGVKTLWLTPHIMEDVPNTTEDLRQRFEALKEQYKGSVRLHLAAEYMMDNLFEQRLEADDLLPLHDRFILVETSYFNPPYQMEQLLERIRERGYTPVLAHPERYQYMDMEHYRHLHQLGIIFQLNVPSLTGAYGEEAMLKSKQLLDLGWYQRLGMDIHSYHFLDAFLRSRILKKELRQLEKIK